MMTPLQPVVALKGLMRSARLWAGKRIPAFTSSNIFSASKHNEVLAGVNCFLNPINGGIVIGGKTEVLITDSGWIIQINPADLGIGGTPSGGGNASVTTLVLKSVQGDYLTCRSWDGRTAGPTDIYVAKRPKLRTSNQGVWIFGVFHQYSYSAGPDQFNPARTNATGAGSEIEYVTPPWLASDVSPNPDLIFAITATTMVNDPNGNPITLLDCGDSRQWAAL